MCCWPCCRSSASESHSDLTLSAKEDSASEDEDSEQPLSAVDVPATGKPKRGEGAARRQPKGSAGAAPQKPEQGPEAKTKKKKNRPGQRARRQHGPLAQQGWGRVQSGLRRFQQVTWAAPSDVYLCCKENITYSTPILRGHLRHARHQGACQVACTYSAAVMLPGCIVTCGGSLTSCELLLTVGSLRQAEIATPVVCLACRWAPHRQASKADQPPSSQLSAKPQGRRQGLGRVSHSLSCTPHGQQNRGRSRGCYQPLLLATKQYLMMTQSHLMSSQSVLLSLQQSPFRSCTPAGRQSRG